MMNTNVKHYEDILNSHEKLVITVKGISMLPLLRQKKDIVVIENKQYRIYDVVLFKRKEQDNSVSFVLHRIVKKYPDGSYLIWGDNCYSGDHVNPEDILGVMTMIIRDGKKISVCSKKYLIYKYFYGAPYRMRTFLKILRGKISKWRHKIEI